MSTARNRRATGNLSHQLATYARSVFRMAVALLAITALALGLVSCEPAHQGSSTSSAQATISSSGQTGEPYGKPWTSLIFSGNLPAHTPEAKDDLYAHYAYDYIAEHQDAGVSSTIYDKQEELRTAVTEAINDAAFTSPELDQLRIFYEQAADEKALSAAGSDELRPYLKAIADTKSLAELQDVLLSDTFPFSPWIDTTVFAPDMMSNMCVAVTPHMLFSDTETGMDMYQDSEDPDVAAARLQTRMQKTVEAEQGISLLSIRDDDDQARELSEKLFDLEKSYGKDCDQNKYLHSDYGTQSESIKVLTLDQLESACPNYPLRQTLQKFDQDKGDSVVVMYPEWLTSFNDIWNDENFELLRDMTELKVLAECADFIDPSYFAGAREQLGAKEPTGSDVAWAACDRIETFTQLLAKVYAERTLGDQTAEDLQTLSNSLIDTYIDLVGNTSWLNAQSRENVMDKIDNMALNILRPDGGYFDYSGLQLVPTAQGGTLFGNYLKLKEYNKRLESELIGQPARASASWLTMRPTEQNCYYDPVSNSINIFPGFITSAMYEKGMGNEEKLAGMGFVLAHEISHAFDYSWSQFDAYGRPIPVFTEDDVQEFVSLRQKLADRYSEIEVVPDKHVDGIAVSAEAAADLCGMQAIADNARNIDGFDYETMFAQLARTWAVVYPQSAANAVLADFHAPYNARINVSAQMTDAFYETFSPSEANAMYLPIDKRVVMWGPNAQ